MGMLKYHYQNQLRWGYKANPSRPISLQFEPQLMLQLAC